MLNHLLLKIIVFIIFINIIYSIIAFLLFKNWTAKTSGRSILSFERISKAREILSSSIICFVCCLLPYRIREIFVFLLHFTLHTLKEKILLIVQLISRILAYAVLFVIYFVALPLTIFLQKIMQKEKIFLSLDTQESDILKRY